MSLSLRIFKLTPQGLGRRKRRIPIEYFIYLRNPCAVFLILSVHPTTFVISWTGCYHLTILSSWPPTHFLNSFRLVSLLFFLHYFNFNLLPSARPVCYPSFVHYHGSSFVYYRHAFFITSTVPFDTTFTLPFFTISTLPSILPTLITYLPFLPSF